MKIVSFFPAVSTQNGIMEICRHKSGYLISKSILPELKTRKKYAVRNCLESAAIELCIKTKRGRNEAPEVVGFYTMQISLTVGSKMV